MPEFFPVYFYGSRSWPPTVVPSFFTSPRYRHIFFIFRGVEGSGSEVTKASRLVLMSRGHGE